MLDVGCGTGASALPAAEIVGPKGVVVGVDLSARMLDRTRAKATERGLRNFEFRLADMTSLDYPDGHFDAVVSVFSIFFVPDMEGLVRPPSLSNISNNLCGCFVPALVAVNISNALSNVYHPKREFSAPSTPR